MQCSGMGIGIQVFGASAFVSGTGVLVLGVLWHRSVAHSHFRALVCLGIGAFGFRHWCRALRQWCSASGWLFWHAWVGGLVFMHCTGPSHICRSVKRHHMRARGGSPVWHSCGALIVAAFLVHAREVHRVAELCRISGGRYVVGKRGWWWAVGWSCR